MFLIIIKTPIKSVLKRKYNYYYNIFLEKC